MSRNQNCMRRSMILALVVLAATTEVSAEEPAPGLWNRLRSAVTQEGKQFRDVLKGQEQMDARDNALQEQLDQGRRLRAMHREAVLLSELNVAWIRDELDHWDCRVAEQKVREVESRIGELSGFGQRLDTLCGGVGADAGYQRKICERQRTELAQAITELEGLGQRYATACPATSRQTGGDQPWR